MLFTSQAYAATSQFRGDIGAMIIDSDPIVKLVLLILFTFSVVSWALIIQKRAVLARARKRGQLILETLTERASMADIVERVDEVGECPLTSLFQAGRSELNRITQKTTQVPLSMLANVENRISVAGVQEGMRLGGGLGFLASISNASPFIGLFGPVWGIMDSFSEIGLRGSANLATVAPGISEALIATAAGLFVAIPAVLFYNYFTTSLSHVTAQMDQFGIEFMNWIRRGLLHGDQ